MRGTASRARASSWLMERACELPYASQRDVARLAQAAGVFRQRLRARRGPQPRTPPSLVGTGEAVAARTYAYAMRAAAPARRCIVLVTPFAVYPPRHGGARRVAALVRALSAAFDIVLVSDEASLYDARSFADFGTLRALHLVERPADANPAQPATLRDRMRSHAHPALARAVAAAVERYRPAIVQVEHAELAELVHGRAPGARWVLGLHDAYGPADFTDPADAAGVRQDAARVRCDHRVLGGGRPAWSRIRGSRASPTAARCRSTPMSRPLRRQLLFVGPFRYAPNRDGIVRFLREAWPAIRAAVPEATLLVLGGDESAEAVAQEPAFAQPGVTVSGHRDDVPALLAQCALTINPLAGIRGSAVKLVEALAAGRVCVSTADGARGFREARAPRPRRRRRRRGHGGAHRRAAHPAGGAAPARGSARVRVGSLFLGAQRGTAARALRRPPARRAPADPVTTNYDRIARFYDVDMARNMPFDDVGFYRALAAAAGGRVLELGCGNGRILLELLAGGHRCDGRRRVRRHARGVAAQGARARAAGPRRADGHPRARAASRALRWSSFPTRSSPT